MNIETNRLLLISCNLEILDAILKGNEHLAELLNINVPENWTENSAPAFEWSVKKLNVDPSEQKWLTYLPVLKEGNILAGCGGYKGKPDVSGMVEIGYEISERFRNKGYASEMAEALIEFAFSDPTITKVIAHTLPEENHSVKVLRKCGMKYAGEAHDDDEGTVWKWEIDRGTKAE